MMTTLIVPGFVYNECLDTMVTDVPKEEGWPEPKTRQRGVGFQAVYEVDDATAKDILIWVRDFASGLTSGVDPETATTMRRVLRWVDKAGSL